MSHARMRVRYTGGSPLSFPVGRITRAFGENMLDYISNLCRGRLDYMERLPDKAILQILLRVDLRDIGRMSQLNKHFNRVSDECPL